MNLDIEEKDKGLIVAGLEHLIEASEDALSRTVGSGHANARDRYEIARERDGAKALMVMMTGQAVMDLH